VSAKLTGTIKKFTDRGFGFITRDDDGPNVFIHHSVLAAAGIAELVAGDRVEFEIVDAARGPRASTVRLID
jgi:CspA family cold shock protein